MSNRRKLRPSICRMVDSDIGRPLYKSVTYKDPGVHIEYPPHKPWVTPSLIKIFKSGRKRPHRASGNQAGKRKKGTT